MLTKYPGHPTRLLEKDQVRSLDEDIRVLHNGYQADRFTIYSLMKDEDVVKKKPDYWKKRYVGAPLVPMNKIRQELALLDSGVTSSQDVLSFTTPSPQPKPPIMWLSSEREQQ